jgi:thermostable 8-oxoguanine DNA glycosylase
MHRLADFRRIVATFSQPVTEERFTREFTWCVYVSGFSSKVIAKKFDALLEAHGIYHAGKFVPAIQATIFNDTKVLPVFANKFKMGHVRKLRNWIAMDGWGPFWSRVGDLKNPADLEKLNGIGPALSCHLARNMGNLDVVKPDKHLIRLSKAYGYSQPIDLCMACKGLTDMRLGEIDLVLWMASVDCGTL